MDLNVVFGRLVILLVVFKFSLDVVSGNKDDINVDELGSSGAIEVTGAKVVVDGFLTVVVVRKSCAIVVGSLGVTVVIVGEFEVEGVVCNVEVVFVDVVVEVEVVVLVVEVVVLVVVDVVVVEVVVVVVVAVE